MDWWERVADIFNQIENQGNWPEALAQAVIPLIPKPGGDATPQNLRPITVLPVLYRAWAGERYDQLEKWVTTWADKELFGGIKEAEAMQAALETSLDIEEEQPHVLHWQTKKPSVAREEFGGHGVGSTTKGKGGKCFKCQQVGHWAAECPN